MSLTSALSITTGVGVPRAVYVDYPLGRTAGKPGDAADQDSIVAAALSALVDMTTAGSVKLLDNQWSSNDDWKARAQRPGWSVDGLHAAPLAAEGSDDRADRSDQPQWQSDADRVAWEHANR